MLGVRPGKLLQLGYLTDVRQRMGGGDAVADAGPGQTEGAAGGEQFRIRTVVLRKHPTEVVAETPAQTLAVHPQGVAGFPVELFGHSGPSGNQIGGFMKEGRHHPFAGCHDAS